MNADELNTLVQEQETAVEDKEPQTVEPEADEPLNDEIEQVEAEAEEPTAEGEAEAEQASEGDEAEYAEVEHNGKKYQVHPDLAEGVMKNADYTRKTQEIAENRRQLEGQQKAIEYQRNASEQEINARAAIASIDQQLQQYANVDWNADTEDPWALQKAQMHMMSLRDTRSKAEQLLGHLQHQRSEQTKQATADRLRQTAEYAQTNIKGWTPDINTKVETFAVQELGFSPEQLTNAYSPQVYRALHLAWLGHQSMQKQTAAPKRQAPTAKPLSKVNAKASPTARKSLSEMSMDEYAATRNKQLGLG
ncbi:MAG: hypothetical protein GY807_20555 [Gammaproteobacteria bacterium]|nr:hypothetical protein [Gammaproteobacteria bacterium]